MHYIIHITFRVISIVIHKNLSLYSQRYILRGNYEKNMHIVNWQLQKMIIIDELVDDDYFYYVIDKITTDYSRTSPSTNAVLLCWSTSQNPWIDLFWIFRWWVKQNNFTGIMFRLNQTYIIIIKITALLLEEGGIDSFGGNKSQEAKASSCSDLTLKSLIGARSFRI